MTLRARSFLRSARGSARPEGNKSDTIALLEAASAPREMSTPLAILLVIALSILAGAVTVLLRARLADGGARARTDAAGAQAGR